MAEARVIYLVMTRIPAGEGAHAGSLRAHPVIYEEESLARSRAELLAAQLDTPCWVFELPDPRWSLEGEAAPWT